MKIYIGAPTRETIHSQTTLSLIALNNLLVENGIDLIMDCSMANNIPYIRNRMVMNAIEMGADALFFVDSDVCFDPETALKLIESEHDYCAAAYRKKKDAEEYCCLIESDADMKPVVGPGGWIELSAAATGLTKFSRRCLEKMIAAHADREYFTDYDDRRMVAVFEYTLKDKKLWGEDYTFSRRWRALGEKIWLWPDAFVQHYGVTSYNGNIHEFLQGTK